MISNQIATRIGQLAEVEAAASFRHYCQLIIAAAQQAIGPISDSDKEQLLPLLRQANEKGLAPDQVAKIIISAA